MKNARLGILTAAFALLVGTAASAQPYNLTVAGYSPGGLVSTIGAGLDKALAAAYPGSTVTYQTSSGGLANAMLLHQQKVPLGFVADTELAVALKGEDPIPEPVDSLRMLLRPYAPGSRFQATQILANKDWADEHGIETFADIAEKQPPMRIAVNRPGNLDGNVSLESLSAIGVSPEDIEEWGGQVVRAASREMTSLMLDRRIDVAHFGISYNHPRIQEMANGVDLVMLPMTEETAQAVADAMGAATCSFTADEYDFLHSDTASVCVGMNMLAHESMDEETAYNVTKAIFEQIDAYKSVHPLLQQAVTPETLAEASGAPFHPGAEKYLKEAGLLQ